MLLLILGLILFLGSHAFPMFQAPRTAAVARLGEMPYKAAFGLVSLLGFALICIGYGQASKIGIWSPPGFMRHLSMLLMLPVFVFLLAAYLPGKIQTTLKHPMLVAVKAWALSHLLVNGDLASILLFGSFLAWAVADRISLKKRPLASSPKLPATQFNDAIVVVGGLAGYGVFAFVLHPLLIGVQVVG